MPGSPTGLASSLSIASAFFSFTATVLKRRAARARSDDEAGGLSRFAAAVAACAGGSPVARI